MGRLKLNLFGKPEVILNGEPVTAFESAKVPALLYYLAVSGQAHRRDTLASLLWGDRPEATARRNLTKALTNLRQLIEPYVLIERHSVAFNHELPYVLDVGVFQAAVEGSARLEPATPERDLAPLRKAVNLYGGDFLAGFYVKNAPEFEAWVSEQRAYLRELVGQALRRLTEVYARFDADQALAYARRWLALEPWQEMGHTQLMLLLAQNGQREAALAQYETCRRLLQAELGVEPTAETRALYERLKAAGTPPPHNLSPPVNAFVGRESELGQITRQLADPDCRLVTIVGPGGIGKTRLALETGRRYIQTETVLLEPNVTDGVYVVSLASIAAEQEPPGPQDLTALSNTLVSAIADAVGLSFHGSTGLRGQLLNYLGPKAMLLVLDNFEHLLDLSEGGVRGDSEPGIDLVTGLLQQAPQVKLLVTSRERLNLQEEWVIEVRGLGYPDGADGRLSVPDPLVSEGNDKLLISNYQRFSAMTLFTQRAQQTLSGFALTEAAIPHVARICQLVEGMPLALELAASWLRVFTPAEIVTEIERSLDFLATSLRNVPARHRSLRAVFKHSWAMLSRKEQGVFARLSIFRGGFSREAATKIAGASPTLLARLVDKSLLRRSAEGRYELHQLLRQYATEKLWGLGEAAGEEPARGAELPAATLAVWQRYSRYYLDFVSRRAELLSGRAPQQATTEIRLALDNIRQAWQWAVTEGWVAELEPAIDGLSRFYDQTGLFQEGEQVFGQAADFLQRHATALAGGSDQARRAAIVRLWIEQARFLTRRGAAERALEIATGAANLAETLQATPLMALTAQQQGESLHYLGRYPAAQLQLERALALAQAARLPAVISKAQLDLGIVAQYQGHFAEAQRWLEQAQRGFEVLEDQRSLNLVFLNLGGVAVHLGDHRQGRRIFEQALGQVRERGDLWVEGMLLNNLGVIAYEEGRYSQAQSACRQALAITRRLMDGANEPFLLHSLGNIARDQGDRVEAERYYQQCLAQCRDRNDRDTETYALADLGLLLHHLNEPEAARDQCRQAVILAEALETQVSQSLALTHLGHALLAMGSIGEAGDAYRRAVALRRELGEHHRAIESQAGMAAAWLAQGEMSPALAEVEAVLAYLAGQPLTGIIEPFRVYLTCYRVLQANQDPRAAEVLATAYRRLQERAAAIEDEPLRRSYLANIPAHRVIVSEVQQRLP